MKEIIIGTNEAGQRIDKFLRKLWPQSTLGQIYKFLRTKKIKVNGKKVPPSYLLIMGDKLEIYSANQEEASPRKVTIAPESASQLAVVYEDNNLLLVNKPAGILVHPASPQDRHTLIQQVLAYLYQKGEYSPEKELTFTPAACNRLDRNTSGLVIIAKNFPSLQILNEMIRLGKIDKYYQGLVKGQIHKKGEIKGYLLKDRQENKVDISSIKKEGAKEIHTVYRPLDANSQYTLLEIQLITGRTHQIRAHLASLHHPLIGDSKYGSKKINDYFWQNFKLKHQFLHAYKLVFTVAPTPLEYLKDKVFMAPLPAELDKIRIKILGQD